MILAPSDSAVLHYRSLTMLKEILPNVHGELSGTFLSY
jgi:hypothetical protein